jgi:hypothetical protein
MIEFSTNIVSILETMLALIGEVWGEELAENGKKKICKVIFDAESDKNGKFLRFKFSTDFIKNLKKLIQ